MRILIEEHQYDVSKVKDVLQGIDALENVEGKVSIHYVGYYYNAFLRDCVFILPKVLVDENELVFGRLNPEDIINIKDANPLTPTERDFIYKFAVWIYRAIVVYKNSKQADSDIVYHVKIAQVGKGLRHLSNTYLDILLQLLQFNRENQNFFFFVVKNMHAGHNKINWTRTISHSAAIVQNGSPVYLNLINKRRQINFDEELLVIFFSILNYIGDVYGFPKDINCNFELIKGAQFEAYLNGLGKTRLLRIKYKYFSDKALELWNLCYAFFDEKRQMRVNTEKKEYLLVKNFNIVFEAIIDELIGDNPLPDGMDKKQDDGKIVDHLFTAKSLIESRKEPTYYIGDSKYYKIGHSLGKESIYKQYTYARNVIQWNLNIFNNGEMPDSKVKLRDDVTEGYNIIPNFFISAKLDEALSYTNDGIDKTDRQNNKHSKMHFKNRLFDRDTLLLFHYDVNFLFVLSLYARDNASQKAEWKHTMRNRFREEIQEWLQNDFKFYAITPRENTDGEQFIKDNFQSLLGKIYTPFETQDGQQYYSLALDKDYPQENAFVLDLIESGFYCKECELGQNPQDVLPKVVQKTVASASQQLLTIHHVQRYLNQHFLVGCYHSQEQYDWIMGKNDKGTNLYNVRLKKRGTEERDGALSSADLAKMDVKFVILYKLGEEGKNEYKVFHVHHHATMDAERMQRAWYPDPRGNYFCYVFDEEVQLSTNIDVATIIVHSQESGNHLEGMPIFLSGEELMKFKVVK